MAWPFSPRKPFWFYFLFDCFLKKSEKKIRKKNGLIKHIKIGGNKYRGLYNIYLKSLGAAIKRHKDMRLDYVVNYSQVISPFLSPLPFVFLLFTNFCGDSSL